MFLLFIMPSIIISNNYENKIACEL